MMSIGILIRINESGVARRVRVAPPRAAAPYQPVVKLLLADGGSFPPDQGAKPEEYREYFEELKGKTDAERIDFYNRRAEALHKALGLE